MTERFQLKSLFSIFTHIRKYYVFITHIVQKTTQHVIYHLTKTMESIAWEFLSEFYAALIETRQVVNYVNQRNINLHFPQFESK